MGELIDLLQSNGMRGQVWLDGSYLTEKENPDDVDLVLLVPAKAFGEMTPEQRSFFDWFRKNSLYEKYRCDNYGLVVDDTSPVGDYMTAYWLRQFGFSRSGELKGLVVIELPFLVKP